jgi:hypothetical protein
MGYQSIFLTCGLAGLEDFHPNYRQTIIERLKIFSQIFVFTNNLEKNQYRDTLDQLNLTLPNYFSNEIVFREFIRSTPNLIIKK